MAAVLETIRRWVGAGPGNGHGRAAALAEPQEPKQILRSAQNDNPGDSSVKGIVGTPNWAGWIQDLGEYNSKLAPPTAFTTYEKMRRSDADVAAALLACDLPIKAADLQVLPGVDKDKPNYRRAAEIAEFVEDNLIGGLEMDVGGRKVSQSVDRVTENALIMLPFGCAAHEPIYAVDGGKICIARYAPRLPSTFYKFTLGADGETLASIDQQGYSADGWKTATLSADSVDFFSFQREGANWWGRSILRTAYKHWYIKEQLERIDAIACERNGLGVPTITQAANASKEDREAAETWLKNLSTHEQTGLSLPFGWTFALNGVAGRPRDVLPSLRYHSEEIVRSVLATFLTLGTTESGSRALGQSSTDFFKISRESTARLIAETMTQGSIRNLVRFNFGDVPPELYPWLSFQNIMSLDPVEILKVVGQLTQQGVIEMDDDAEAWAREKLGMPVKGTPRAAPLPPQGMGEEENQKANGKGQKAEGNDEGGTQNDEQKNNVSASDVHRSSLSVHSSERSSRASRRELKAFEQKVDYDALRRRQDATAKKVARLLRAAKPEAIKQAARMASMMPTVHLQGLALPADPRVISQIEEAVGPAFDFGRTSVRRERMKATGRRGNRPAVQLVEKSYSAGFQPAGRQDGGATLLADRLSRAKDAPRLVAAATWADFANWIAPRAIAAAVDASKRGIVGEALAGAIEGALDELADRGLDSIGMEAGRGAVAGGRYSTLAEFDAEISRYIRTEADDDRTCEICNAADGTEWNSLDEIDWQPGDDCLGGDLCRGQIVAVFADEGKVTTQ